MEDESGNERPGNNGLNPPFSGSGGATGGPTDLWLDRLPPPMFPEGTGRRSSRPMQSAARPEEDHGIPEDAFIMPDEPVRRTEDAGAPEEPAGAVWAPLSAFDSALIDPDAPIVRSEPPRTPADYERVVRGGAPVEVEVDEGVVTGIGDDSHEEDEEALERVSVYDGDPHLGELVQAVKRLSDALDARGEAGLRTTADMTRFEATLRAYCVGYLTRAREERE